MSLKLCVLLKQSSTTKYQYFTFELPCDETKCPVSRCNPISSGHAVGYQPNILHAPLYLVTITHSPHTNFFHRVVSEEKTHRQELSHLKIKHESGLAIMKDELHSLNQQVSKYKRERDTYKTMLEGAQRTIGDLKRRAEPKTAAAMPPMLQM